MPAMGAQPEEIIRRFERCARLLPHVRAAFVTIDQRSPHHLTFWALLDDYDETTEDRLINFESQIEQEVGEETRLRFRILYLRGRAPNAVIPPDARLLKSA
jgi:hypothetical protein